MIAKLQLHLDRERRRRSWPALQTWCVLKALVSSAYFRPNGCFCHGFHFVCSMFHAVSHILAGMQRNSGKFTLRSWRSPGWFRVQKGRDFWDQQSRNSRLLKLLSLLRQTAQVARFFNMVGLLADFLGVHSNKELRSWKWQPWWSSDILNILFQDACLYHQWFLQKITIIIIIIYILFELMWPFDHVFRELAMR